MNTGFTQAEILQLRKDFPLIANKKVNEHPLIYFDSAATTQKPIQVLKAEEDFLKTSNSAVHRGVHTLADQSTEAYEVARAKVAKFIGASSAKEIVFTKNTTESLNLLAYTLGTVEAKSILGHPLGPGDEILITRLEHHANLVPWQQLARRTGAKLTWFDVDKEGRIAFQPEKITDNTKLIAFTHVSNVTGAVTEVEKIVKVAKEKNILTILDACQSVPHQTVKVSSMGIDFLAFSGHKMLGPYGIGVLYGREGLLQNLPPFLFGGSMVKQVTMEEANFMDSPTRFEAGVPAVSQAVALGTAIDYLTQIGLDNITQYEKYLADYLLTKLLEIPGINLIGPANNLNRNAIISFNLAGVHPHDLGQILDSRGIAIRVGHHCAMPVHEYYQVKSSARASLYLYNLESEVDDFIAAIKQAKNFFKV